MNHKVEDIYVVMANGVPLHAVKTARQAARFQLDILNYGLADKGFVSTITSKKIKLIYPRELSVKQLGHVKAILTKKEPYDQNQS